MYFNNSFDGCIVSSESKYMPRFRSLKQLRVQVCDLEGISSVKGLQKGKQYEILRPPTCGFPFVHA